MFPTAPLRRAASVLAASAALFLAACGGGGGGDGGSSAPVGTTLLPPSSRLANVCTAEGQKQWVRSYLHETYLWADEVQEVDAGAYTTPAAYFDALLVRTPGPDGLPRDRFSTTMTAAAANAMQGTSSASADLAAAANPVPLVRTYLTRRGKAGYILFNQHTQGAQDALIDAFASLRGAGVNDLVLDLRYNAGGFIYVAQAAAAMVAGESADGQVFESVRYSAKRSAENEGGTFYFRKVVQKAESRYPAGHPLPQLGLSRVYVLTSGLTCSASESIINGLRGIGVQVVLVGDRTCGKPYGFHRKDNCGQSYFPIEFQMFNAQGFGDYASGFPVQCQVRENPRTALGATDEPLLAAALGHIDSGQCPAGTFTGVVARMVQPEDGSAVPTRAHAPSWDSPMYQPGFDGRVLQP